MWCSSGEHMHHVLREVVKGQSMGILVIIIGKDQIF